MKRIISGIAAGFALLSVVSIAQAAPICIGGAAQGTGQTADSPLCPDPILGKIRTYSILIDKGPTYWFESEYGVNYEYISQGAAFASIELSGIGSSVFELSLLKADGWEVESDWSLVNGANTFRLSATTWDSAIAMGSAFATGLTFSEANETPVYQISMGESVSSGTVPEPATLFLIGSGLLGVGWRRKKN